METFENWVDTDLKVDASVPIFVKDAEDLFNEDLRPQNKPLLPFLMLKLSQNIAHFIQYHALSYTIFTHEI